MGKSPKNASLSLQLSDQLNLVSGIGPKTADLLVDYGLKTVGDLLLFLPRSYDDYSSVVNIASLRPGQCTIRGHFSSLHTRRVRRGLAITEALISDNTASTKVVWFNQPYRETSIKRGSEYYLSGTYRLSRSQFSFINPTIELVSEVPINSARIVPRYKQTKSLSSALFRKAIHQVLPISDQVAEFIPESVLKAAKQPPLNSALKQMHFPQSLEALNEAKQRFAFNELFPFLLANELTKKDALKNKALIVPFNLGLAKDFVAKLPFKLTDDQRRVIWQIYQDLGRSVPMNRLVEGDVGSGKTVICVMAAVMALSEGLTTAFMAPTELLARQHAETISKLLKPLGFEDRLVLLTGSMSVKQKANASQFAKTDQGRLIVGTHSLLTADIDLQKLAILIIDEQHRFGVDQRLALQKKTGHRPHFLSITATPIPRSLALTFLSDLDLSRITTKPARRVTIKSELIAPSKTNALITRLKAELTKGRQVYVVCPHIHSKGSDDQIAAETQFLKYIQLFPKNRVGLIHGQLKSDEQNQVMSDFLKGNIQILVATTVIEVGVDVANASTIVVYGPEHYGLAQLHQLRGRVGRSEHPSHCYLVLSDSNEPLARLRQFTHINDGFELSELDLKLRGPGAIYGKLQHGKGANMLTLDDHDLLNKAKLGVKTFFAAKEKLLNYKELARLVEAAQQLTNLN